MAALVTVLIRLVLVACTVFVALAITDTVTSESQFNRTSILLQSLPRSLERYTLEIGKVKAGMSNRMLSLASGVALAMVMQRTPVFDWSGSDFSQLFGRSNVPKIIHHKFCLSSNFFLA